MDEYIRPLLATVGGLSGTLKAAFLSALAALSFVADIAAGSEGTLLGQGLIATVLGFLGWFVKSWLSDIRGEVRVTREESKALRLAIEQNTRVNCIALLELSALIPGARGMLETAKKGAEERIAKAAKSDIKA